MIISENTYLSKIYDENLVVKESATLKIHGIFNGDIHLSENSLLYHHGIINGNITVEPNCQFFIHGILNGNLINSGYSQLYGMFNTKEPIPSSLIIEKDSIINGVRY